MNKVLVLVVTLFAQFAFGAVLETQAGSKQISGVTLAQSAKFSANSQSTDLKMVGAGLRKKKVLMMTVDVYVAQLFLSSPQTFNRTDSQALPSASTSNVAAVQLTFVRDVPADKIKTSFLDALQANKVNLQESDIKDFLAAVSGSGDAKSGRTLTIVISKDNAGNESLTYEDTDGKASLVKGSAGLAGKVLSIWLGVPADAELGATKSQIISGN